jgi:ABC-type branched-subunit amino acid transport system substrate-binding protein
MRSRVVGVALVVTAATVASLAGVGSVGAARSVRGFDGKTITIAGMGILSTLPLTQVGAQARVKRFNDTNELKGIKLNLADFADDKSDPATSLSEARRLVTQVGAFAVVPEISRVSPVDYFTQAHVPYFGGGFNSTYCSHNPSKALWGWSVTGCPTAADPSFVMKFPALYTFVHDKSGKKTPTLSIIGTDDSTSKDTTHVLAIRATASGLKVASTSNNAPTTGVSDFTPYANELLTSANGAAPDSIYCLMSTACLGLLDVLKSRSYTGAFITPLYTNVLVKGLAKSQVSPNTVNPADNPAGYKQMKADMDAYQAGSSAKLDSGAIYGYSSVDAFIQAVKAVAKGGTSKITPENVQKYASTMTWQIKGVIGPVQYPKSTVMPYPSCNTVLESDGTQWVTKVPYTCTTESVSPNIKVG